MYQAEKDKYFQEAWSGEPFKNKVCTVKPTVAPTVTPGGERAAVECMSRPSACPTFVLPAKGKVLCRVL